MAWIYQQSTGQLSHNGRLVATGYAGKDEGKNIPDMQDRVDIGPLPRGNYTITNPFHHPHTGPYSMRLQPSHGNVMYGRAGFLIHGDSIESPGEASNGCIVMPPDVRRRIWTSGDRQLEVIW